MSFLTCSYASVCAGCDQLLLPEADQADAKTQDLIETWTRAGLGSLLPEINFITIDRGGLRDRVDLMVDRRHGSYKLGLFDKFHTGLVDLQGCPQMSPALEDWFTDFRRLVEIPVQRGSLRLRVAPDGRRGLWLDLANVDIKQMLDERVVLDRLLASGAIIEIGQKRKRLIEVEGRLKLGDARLEAWFETYLPEPQPLYCRIGSFTQPGFRANQALVGAVMASIRETGARCITEFGSGIGNFTMPLAFIGEQVDAYEVDELALEGLRRSLNESGLANVVIHSGNFQVARAVSFSGVDLVMVDPPRSGLLGFLDPLEATPLPERPPHFLYVSCFAESFAQDSARLLAMGYRVRSVAIVDQFPQSRHYEIVAHFAL